MEKIIKRHEQKMRCKRCGHEWTRIIINTDVPYATEICLHDYCGCGTHIQHEVEGEN
jgi:C4-type Zn-finger protein